MKKIFTAVLFMFIMMPVLIHSGNRIQGEKNKIKSDLTERKKEDREYREKVIKDVQAHMQFINKQLKYGSGSEIVTPIDYDKIEDAKKNEQPHSDKKIPAKVFGFINSDHVIMRTEPAKKSKEAGKLFFQTRVEMILKSEEKETINGVEECWILIRKENGDEGWIFGVYIQKEKPERQIKQEEKKDQRPSSDSFIIPAEGYRSSNFGNRVHPVTKKRYSFHSGIDIAAKTGTPIKAAEKGIVKISEFKKNGYGNLIVIQHEKDLTTYYGHQSKRLKKEGDKVAKGDIIGEVGSTGMSTGPHLHFEVRRGGTAMNPDQYLR